MAGLATKLPWELAQPRWAAQLNPILANPVLAGHQIDDIVLVANTALTINHLLGRGPQGWFIVDNSANSVVWRSAPFTINFLVLTASANTTISVWVY